MEHVRAGHASKDGAYRDFCDGSFVQNHPMFKENREVLLLSFYFDEVEVANPLGSKRGKHKLGMCHAFMSSSTNENVYRCFLLDAFKYPPCIPVYLTLYPASHCSEV